MSKRKRTESVEEARLSPLTQRIFKEVGKDITLLFQMSDPKNGEDIPVSFTFDRVSYLITNTIALYGEIKINNDSIWRYICYDFNEKVFYLGFIGSNGLIKKVEDLKVQENDELRTKFLECLNNLKAFYTHYERGTKISEILNSELSIKTRNRLLEENFNTLADVIDYGVENLKNIRGLGSKGHYEISKILENIEKGKDEFDPLEFIENKYNCVDDFFQLKYEQLIEEKQLPNRVKNYILKHLGSYKDFVKFGEEQYKFYMQTTGNIRYTYLKIRSLYKDDFLPFMKENYNLNGPLSRQCIIAIKYPFLKKEQVEFVQEYESTKGHLPLIYIIYYYVCSSKDKSKNKIIDLVCGFSYYKCETMDYVAGVMGITSERIRQIVSYGISLDISNDNAIGSKKRENLFEGEDFKILQHESYKELFSKVYISQYTSLPKDVQTEKDGIGGTFRAFAKIVQLIGNEFNCSSKTPQKANLDETASKIMFEELCVVNKENDTKQWILINSTKGDILYEIRLIGNIFNKLVSRNYSEDTTISYEKFFSPRLEKRAKEINCEKVIYSLIKEVAEKNFNLQTDDSGVIFKESKSRYSRLSDDIYSLLNNSSRPLHIAQIWSSLLESHPNIGYEELLSTIRMDTGRFKELSDMKFWIQGKD